MVVVKKVSIDRNFRDKEKLDLEFTVATYKTPTVESDESKNKDDDGEDS